MQGVDAGGNMVLHSLRSPLCNASEYTEGLQRCSEKHRVQCTRSYSDNTVVIELDLISCVPK